MRQPNRGLKEVRDIVTNGTNAAEHDHRHKPLDIIVVSSIVRPLIHDGMGIRTQASIRRRRFWVSLWFLKISNQLTAWPMASNSMAWLIKLISVWTSVSFGSVTPCILIRFSTASPGWLWAISQRGDSGMNGIMATRRSAKIICAATANRHSN